jgi:hypothetical protein
LMSLSGPVGAVIRDLIADRILNRKGTGSIASAKGLKVPPTLPAVGATLVVAPFRHRVRGQQGDHEGRAYLIIESPFRDARIHQVG